LIFAKNKKPEPNASKYIAPTKKIEAIGSGIPFDEIYSTIFEKSKSLPESRYKY